MTAFLIQSGISLAVLLAVYKLLLQREKMHVFNRFYLLFAICFSFLIPFIEIGIKSEILPVMKRAAETITHPPPFMDPFYTPPVPRINIFPFILLMVYMIGAAVMFFRFAINLGQLISVIVKNETLPFANATLVWVKKPILPHSFLHYIFVSTTDLVEKELLDHELTHVRQRHTLDIIFIEILKIVFWFNPLIHLYRKAIKLNHEFLADQWVLQTNNNVISYQEILLNKLFMNKASGLASHVHYSLTKKRLIMMTKSTSKWRAVLLKLAVLPLFAALVLVFCVKAVAQDPPPPPPNKEKTKEDKFTKAKKLLAPQLIAGYSVSVDNIHPDSLRKMKDRWYGGRDKPIYSFKYNGQEAVEKRYEDMTEAEKAALPPPPPYPELKLPTQQQLDDWLDTKKFGVWIDADKVSNEELKRYKPEDFGLYFVSRLHKDAKNYGKYEFQVNLTSRQAFDAYLMLYKAKRGLREKQR